MPQKLLLLIIISVQLSFYAAGQENWNTVKDETGIKVFTKTVSGSRYKAFKAEMQLNCKIENIIEVLKNTDSNNGWIVNCKEVKLLKTDGNDQYFYIETSLPLPFQNRDMVYHFQYVETNKEQVRVNVMGIPDYIRPNAGIVRMVKADGYWLLISIGKEMTSVTYQMHVEPGGLIPAWLANPFIKNVPFSTFKELRSIIQKSK